MTLPRFLLGFAALGAALLAADAPVRPAISIRLGDDGKLAYATDTAGNRVIDFSHAGYGGGGEAIPFVPAKIVVAPEGRRDGARIQAALDLVAAMPVGADGFRGAVLLQPGRYLIDTSLRLGVSGVVLRSSGDGEFPPLELRGHRTSGAKPTRRTQPSLRLQRTDRRR